MVFPTRVLIPPARFLPDMMTSFTYTLPFLVGEGSGPMWKKTEWKDVHPDAQTTKLGKLARERLKADAEAARREALKQKEMEREKGSLQKAKAQALFARPYSSTKPNQHPSQTASLAHNAYPVPASLTKQSQHQDTTTMMEQPPSSSSGSGDGKDDDMPPAAAGMMKRTVPAPSVFWTDHLRMI